MRLRLQQVGIMDGSRELSAGNLNMHNRDFRDISMDHLVGTCREMRLDK